MFFVTGLPSCFVLPCFATGCHTFGLKIATAATRPRNDTKMVGFAIKPTIFISKMFEIRLAGAPCFATGCHTFGFQIATAATRPRNDIKNGRFCNKTYHFYSKMFEIRATLRRASKGAASERRSAPVRVSRGRSAGAYRAALLTGSIFRAGYSGRRGCREFRRSRRRICRAARPARCARRPRSPHRARSRRSRPDRRR